MMTMMMMMTMTLRRLQRVQDAAARLLCREPPRTHARPLLKQLHWLSVSSRFQFKLCTLMFDVYHGTALSYITELCRRFHDTQHRSTARGDYAVPTTRRHFVDKSFAVARSTAWNSLLQSVRKVKSKQTFRRYLKTFLFTQCFE